MKVEEGIYYIQGGYFPMQLIFTSELSKELNFWLRNLTNRLKEITEAKRVLTEYYKHKDDMLYDAVMNVITRANSKIFEEGEEMCEAFFELKNVQAKFEEARKESENLGKRNTLLELLKDGLLTVADVASRLNVTEAEVKTMLGN